MSTRSVGVLTDVLGVVYGGTMQGIDLKVERVRARVKQQDLAAAIGVSRATVISWESAAVVPEYKARAYLDALKTFADVTRSAA
jgi:DNA-binding transcriptional regulator YiaG